MLTDKIKTLLSDTGTYRRRTLQAVARETGATLLDVMLALKSDAGAFNVTYGESGGIYLSLRKSWSDIATDSV
jgi:hypothetical protein